MSDALDVVRRWRERMRARDFDHMGDAVDLEGYTEICLGLTDWTVGFEVALANYVKNIVRPWSDVHVREDALVTGSNTVVMRTHTTATHSGEFLGVPATGRRVEWDAITMVQVEHGRVVGQWAQPDLMSIYRQIASDDISGVANVAAPSTGAPAWARSAA
jgi:predicted ester cyclase